MRQKRAESARIWIPDVVDPKRRELCLGDPERFLRTYFAKQFFRPFERIHKIMINDIYEVAEHGGRKAVAAPRGCGKSETTKGMLAYLIFACMVSFPVPIAASNKLAQRMYNDFRSKCAFNDLLLEDFPEICFPVRALEGAPQRAQRQHVDGRLTRIVWTADDFLRLADVEGSPYGDVKMAFAGLDTAIRGLNIDGDRPDLLVIDDPETRESAKSALQIEARMDMVDKDLAGLGTDDNPLSIIMLTTVQNRYCASWQYTDREQNPAWDGERKGRIVTWPERMDLWEDYVAKRQIDQSNGDRYGKTAVEYYKEHFDEMNRGCEMLSEYYKPTILRDGFQVTHSALQICWNIIADTSMEAFRTEYQNDPPAELESEKVPLTVGRVLQQTSGLIRGEVPEQETVCCTIGIDIGKRVHHWVKVLWDDDATGWIIDYDVVTTHGLSRIASQQAIEKAIAEALFAFSDSDVFEDVRPDITLFDSGYCADAVYEVTNQLGFSFYPIKGQSLTQFRQQKANQDTVPFWEAYARRTVDHLNRPMWLYHANVEYWKDWVQHRFLIEPWTEAGVRTPGSLALFEPDGGDVRFHRTFARHMVSEGLEMVPKEGKLDKPTWVVRDARHNHWLDALGYAAAAAGCYGIRAINPPPPEPQPRIEEKPLVETITTPSGQPFLATETA